MYVEAFCVEKIKNIYKIYIKKTKKQKKKYQE